MSSSATTPVDSEGAESDSAITEYLSDHPRMLGGLFTVLLLLTQVGNVAADESASIAGP